VRPLPLQPLSASHYWAPADRRRGAARSGARGRGPEPVTATTAARRGAQAVGARPQGSCCRRLRLAGHGGRSSHRAVGSRLRRGRGRGRFVEEDLTAGTGRRSAASGRRRRRSRAHGCWRAMGVKAAAWPPGRPGCGLRPPGAASRGRGACRRGRLETGLGHQAARGNYLQPATRGHGVEATGRGVARYLPERGAATWSESRKRVRDGAGHGCRYGMQIPVPRPMPSSCGIMADASVPQAWLVGRAPIGGRRQSRRSSASLVRKSSMKRKKIDFLLVTSFH